MLRAYLIGFEPGGITESLDERRRMIDSVDFCILSEHALAIGYAFEVTETIKKVGAAKVGTFWRVVGHEQRGKIVQLEKVEPS